MRVIYMELSKSAVKRIMKDVTKEDKYNISKEAIDYMGNKIVEFCKRLTKNSLEEVKAEGMKTVKKRHLHRTLGRIDLVLKNMPRTDDIDKGNEKEA